MCKGVRYMGRRVIIVTFAAVSLAVMSLIGSACGGDKAIAQPSSSVVAEPRLLDIGDFSLMEKRPTHVLLHVTKAHPLRILILADQALDSISLRRMAAADGSVVPPETVRLKGSPHNLDGQTVYALTTRSIESGYLRLDLLGHGRVQSLAVQDW
jgi:hypothetical protein